jgi:CRP-like cAMP-binding protein
MNREPLQNERRENFHQARAMAIHSYRYGEQIIGEGESTDCFFVILSGQVRITQRSKKLRLLGDQDVFGIENVIFNKPSPVTAKAVSRCRIAAYGQDALDHFIRETPGMVYSLLSSTLHQLSQMAAGLTGQSEVFALEEIRMDFFSDEEEIIKEGTIGTDFYRLVSSQGGLRVTIQGMEISRIEKPGEFFGEMAGLLKLPRQATVTSIGESTVEVYSFDSLDVIIRDYPEVALQMMQTLVTRLMDANQKLTGTLKP